MENNKLYNKKNMPACQRGFTLVEVVVAIAIFVIVAVGSSGIFAAAYKSYRGARNVNENLKNAQFAINLISKTFRTSTIKIPASGSLNTSLSSIVIYDYSQALCIRYRISGGDLLRATSTDSEANCDDTPSPAFTDATMVSGVSSEPSFFITNSRGNESLGSSDRVGKITVKLHITSGSGATSSKVIVQSTSSLRDYEISNIGIDPNNDPN